jgi:hypothetical protein
VIVEEPPYDLVAVFADADAKALFEELIERGQERSCIHEIRWRSLRDPMRDTVRADPLQILRPFLGPNPPRVMIVWDHDGSGAEDRAPADVEAEVCTKIVQCGAPHDGVRAVALVPEVEAVFEPVWARVKEVLARIRDQMSPADDEVFVEARKRWNVRRGPFPGDVATALRDRPKEMLEALIWILNLRFSSSLFTALGREVSIPGVKGNTAAAQALGVLVDWFPPAQ